MNPAPGEFPRYSVGKKTLENCNVNNFDNRVKAVVAAHMKEYKNKWQITA